MKRILVPTDFSDCAASALQYAAILARKAEADIVLIHACDLLITNFQSRKELIHEYNRNQTATLRRKLEALRMEIEDTGRIQVITRLYEGNPQASMLLAIKDTGSDLVVMGTLGASKTANLIFGSQTASMIGKCPVPLIVVPEGYKAQEPTHILLATRDIADTKYSEMVFNIARMFRAQVTVVVFEPEQEVASALLEANRSRYAVADHLQRHHRDFPINSEVITGTDLQNGLQQCVLTHKASMLAMITHPHKGLFERSMTRKMSYHTQIPLLALPAIAEKEVV